MKISSSETSDSEPPYEIEGALIARVRVGVGDVKAGKPPDVLTTVLGSCVGIVLYDPEARVGAMGHVMLTSSDGKPGKPGKFADTAIPEMLRLITHHGGHLRRLQAKLIGGASMFDFSNHAFAEIGKRNVDSVRECLFKHNVRVVSEEVGGTCGRTIEFDLETGKVIVKVRNDIFRIM